MLKERKSELFITLRLIIFNLSILAGLFIFKKFDAQTKKIVIRLPNACAKTVMVKGQEYVNYSCFRTLLTAEIKEEKLYGNH